MIRVRQYFFKRGTICIENLKCFARLARIDTWSTSSTWGMARTFVGSPQPASSAGPFSSSSSSSLGWRESRNAASLLSPLLVSWVGISFEASFYSERDLERVLERVSPQIRSLVIYQLCPLLPIARKACLDFTTVYYFYLPITLFSSHNHFGDFVDRRQCLLGSGSCCRRPLLRASW